MGYKLVIAEKGKLARDIGRAMCRDDVDDRTKLPIRGNGYVVAAASGHLLELEEPAEIDPSLAEYRIEDLPIWFPDWPKVVRRATDEAGRKRLGSPDPSAQRRLDTIEGLLAGADAVYNAGDPDDEGQALVDEIVDALGWTGPVMRVYVNDSIPKNIRRAFEQAVDNAGARSDGEAACARALGDMAFGVNESRLISCRLHAGNLSVGRVQTPTLGLVVARDAAIEGHVKTPYWEAAAKVSVAGEEVEMRAVPDGEWAAERSPDGKHVTDEEAMRGFSDAVAAAGVVEVAVERGQERRAAPLPYNITKLEEDMNRRFGMRAAETLAVTQSLRDKHDAITYNRTSSGYLKTEHWEQAADVLGVAMRNIGRSDVPLDFSLKSRAFDDSKVTAHHGIIPQEVAVDTSAMTDAERKVYTAIVERYAAQFCPPAVYDTCRAAAAVPGGRLEYSAKRMREPGWTAWFDRDGKKGQAAAPAPALLPEGRHAGRVLGCSTVRKETRPPKPYTEATLLADMASIAKYVRDPELKAVLIKKDEGDPEEHGGIGTSATRPGIIETLKRRGFIEERSGKVRSTERGRAVYGLVPDDLKTADVTARWALLCEDVRAGRAGREAVGQAVVAEFERHKETAYTGIEVPSCLRTGGGRRPEVGACPRCGAPVAMGKKSAQCSTNRWRKTADGTFERTEGCGWRMRTTVAHKALTQRQVERLLAGATVAVRGLKSKSGKTFDQKLALKPDDGGEWADIEFCGFPDGGRKQARRGRGPSRGRAAAVRRRR